MTSSVRHPLRRGLLAGALAAIGLTALLGASQAPAATVYPAGGSTFTGSAEGWKVVGEPSCTLPLPLLCEATAGFDGSAGNPTGAISANAKFLVNVAGLFKSTASFESPNFLATEGGAGTLRLERAISSSNLVDLTPQASYEVTLLDRTSSTSSSVLSGQVTGPNAPFGGEAGAVSLIEGHAYAISVDVETTSSLAAVGLLGSTATLFDNVSITVGSSLSGGGGGVGGAGGGAGSGGGGDGSAGSGKSATFSSLQLRRLIQSSMVGSARLKGKRLLVRAKCPKRIGRACRVTLQGFLRKGRAATTKRNVRIGKGKSKRVALRVKPKLRSKVRKRQKLLIKQTVRARGTKATVYKRMKLVRR